MDSCRYSASVSIVGASHNASGSPDFSTFTFGHPCAHVPVRAWPSLHYLQLPATSLRGMVGLLCQLHTVGPGTAPDHSPQLGGSCTWRHRAGYPWLLTGVLGARCGSREWGWASPIPSLVVPHGTFRSPENRMQQQRVGLGQPDPIASASLWFPARVLARDQGAQKPHVVAQSGAISYGSWLPFPQLSPNRENNRVHSPWSSSLNFHSYVVEG